MLLFRSLALGLLGACFFMLATRPTTIVVRAAPRIEHPTATAAAPVPTVIDVAANVDASALPSLVRLGVAEHVVAVDDERVANDLDAGRLLVTRSATPKSYVDLQISGPSGERRVLVLMH